MTDIALDEKALAAARELVEANIVSGDIDDETAVVTVAGLIGDIAATLPANGAGWREMPAPDLKRVVVAGWQKQSGTTRGYWWYYEDVTDDRGVPMDHPEASLWLSLSDLLPAFPSAPDRRAGE